MADEIVVQKYNESYIKVVTDEGIFRELSDYLTFYAPNYKWNPKYKNRIWDGKIRLLNSRTKLCYSGLIKRIEKFALDRDYTFYDDTDSYATEFSLIEAQEFINTLNLPYAPRDYQIKYFVNAIRNRKSLEISPTASGKSLIIYMILRWVLQNEPDTKALIVVPTVALTRQLLTDFEEYGWHDAEKYCHAISAGIEKTSNHQVYISTWQSIFTMPDSYFKAFSFVLGDEAHESDAKSLKHIMESCVNARYRIGTTGTIKDSKVSIFTLEGLFGPFNQITTTLELMEQGYLADLSIKALILKHPDNICKAAKSLNYQEEIEYLISSKRRNEYITNLAVSCKGNTLILYRYVDKHGKILDEMIREKLKNTDRNVFYIDGNTDISDREDYRKAMETENGAILIASTGTFSRGSNIKNLHNLIIAFPSKAKVRLLQSIGRTLRKLGDKKAVLYDIADDLRSGKTENITLKHFIERVKVYNKENFKFKLYKIQLK